MATIDYITTTTDGTVTTNSDFDLPSQEDLELARDALLFYGKPAVAPLPRYFSLREMVAMQEESLRKSAELRALWREQQEQLQAAAAAAKAKADALAKLSPGQRRMANLLWETPP